MKRIVEPEVMDTREEAEAYDAMGHGEVDRAFAERFLELGGGGLGMCWMSDAGRRRYRSCWRSAVLRCVSRRRTCRKRC